MSVEMKDAVVNTNEANIGIDTSAASTVTDHDHPISPGVEVLDRRRFAVQLQMTIDERST